MLKHYILFLSLVKHGIYEETSILVNSLYELVHISTGLLASNVILSYCHLLLHLGPYSQKVLGLNIPYRSSKFKPKTVASPFMNTSPENLFI